MYIATRRARLEAREAGFLVGIIRIGKIPLSAKGITDEITDNHPIDICSVGMKKIVIL